MITFKKIVYWVSTIAICGVMLYSATIYFTKTQMVKGFFESFNYPTYIVIPLGVAKLLGVIAILWQPKSWVVHWAYAGFFFDLVLATVAHYFAQHGFGLSFYAIIILLVSYASNKHVRI